ncbi:hypothetical protein HMPREF2909_02415 [Alloscardovia sp. HMSC034E08]|nr:hypothetical protein HMPREF2909_02415 [Alloscardovia sp. HMSC034E08]
MILWCILGCIALWMALRYLPAGWDSFGPLPFITALIPLLAIPLCGVLALSLFTHSTTQVWTSIALLIVHIVWSLTYFVPLPAEIMPVLGSPRQSMNSAVSTDSEQTITVMTLNARYGHADTSAIIHTLKQMNVDVLAVQEVSSDFVKRLHEAGIDTLMPHEQLGEKKASDNGGFNALWSRYLVTQSGSTLLNNMGSHTPWITVQVNNQAVHIVSTHPYSPQRSTEQWHHDITALASLSSGTDVPTIVMGDMNSSTVHPSLRSTINTGLLDSSLELHSGAHPTFPSSWTFLPSMIEIDHVLHTREMQSVSVKTAVIPRTDHKALIATLSWR